MIQDILPSVMDNSYRNKKPSDESKIVYFREGKLMIKVDGSTDDFEFPLWKEVRGNESGETASEPVFLFSIDKDDYFLVWNVERMPENAEFRAVNDIRKLKLSGHVNIFAVFTAYHLWKWYSVNRCCGVCGSPMVHSERSRSMRCPECGNKVYPRINPAVIIGVTNGDNLLLIRYRERYRHNALVAGFTEIGETVEETVAREVMEETGLRIKNIRYYKSQPWGIAEDVLMGFYCDVDGDDTIHIDEHELKYAEWVRREDIILQPADYSLTNEMMKMFKEGNNV